jgi:alpha-glucosidase (family GH31 glycosyl hydrolase)
MKMIEDTQVSRLLEVFNLIKVNRMSDASQKLDGISVSAESLPIQSFYLYLKTYLVDELSSEDFAMIQRIECEWSDAQTNLFGEDADIYTSNLTNYYACLQEVKNKFGHFHLQQTMTKIRDYLFDHMIKGNRLVGKMSTKAVTFDELLGVLPFGVFAPEDLIVVAAQEELVARNTNNPIFQALLGIYFTEKYELEKAKYYLDAVISSSPLDPIATEFTTLLQTYLTEKIGNQSVEFIHKPFGHGNVYETLPYERCPHEPFVGESFTVKVQVLGTEEVPSLHLNDVEYTGERIDAALNLFQYCIQAEAAMNLKEYYFVIETKDGLFQSESYLLELREKGSVQEFIALGVGEYGNIYQASTRATDGTSQTTNEKSSLYIIMKEHDFSVSQVLPHVASEHLNPDFMILDVDTLTIQYHGKTLPLVKENPIEITWLLDQGIATFALNFEDLLETNYFGFGERYNEINQKGNVIDCFVYNQYRDQGTKTYMPMPYFVTNQNYGIFVETDGYTKFDLQKSHRGQVSITVECEAGKPEFSFVLLDGTMKEMVHQFISRSGTPAMLPVWALGPWMSSNNWDRDSVVRKEIATTNELDIPSTVIVLEQWSDEATYYMWNDAQYSAIDPAKCYRYEDIQYPEWGRWPNPQALVEHCHDNGLKFILWQVPIEKYLNQQHHPLKDRDEAYMIEKGYAVKNADGSPYRIPENWYTDSLLLDFTNPDARKWWFDKRQYLIDIGVDGFKTDGGEMVFGRDVRFHDGSTGLTMRNQYPNEYIRSYYEFAQQNDGMTFSRSGYTGCGQFPAHWAGDERSTFDAFKRSLKAGINAGLSGVIFWGWDLAGFNGDIPTAELFIRSSQMAAFCPIMQYHAESKGEFNQDRTPWNIANRTGNEDVIRIYRKFANIRMNLLPYLYWQSKLCVEKAQPLMKAMILEYPSASLSGSPNIDFTNTYDQYLLGEHLLIAPIIEEHATQRTVKLPSGKWIDFWSKEIIDVDENGCGGRGGREIVVHAEIDTIPVFIKANAVIPLNLGEARTLGTTIGNDLESYQNLKLIVTCESSFETDIEDYLGHHIHVAVTKDEVYNVTITGVDFNIEVELIEL